MWNRRDLKTKAKVALKRNYWGAVIVSVIAAIITGGGSAASANSGSNSAELQAAVDQAISGMDLGGLIALLTILLGVVALASTVSIAVDLFLGNPLQVGTNRFFLLCENEEKASSKEILYAFKNSYMNIVKGMFTTDLVIFLWSLLLIVPGIIKAFEYMMVPYILAEDPDMSGKEARKLSKQMMAGNKWKAFVLGLSFFGWLLLGGITCGILLIFYVNPYVNLTFAELYHALKGERAGGIVEPA